MQNFITIRLPLSPPKYAKNAHKVSRLVLFWLFRRPTAETPAPIFTLNTSNDVLRDTPKSTSRKDVPLGSRNQNFIFRPQSNKGNLGAIFDSTEKISAQKPYNGDAHL